MLQVHLLCQRLQSYLFVALCALPLCARSNPSSTNGKTILAMLRKKQHVLCAKFGTRARPILSIVRSQVRARRRLHSQGLAHESQSRRIRLDSLHLLDPAIPRVQHPVGLKLILVGGQMSRLLLCLDVALVAHRVGQLKLALTPTKGTSSSMVCASMELDIPENILSCGSMKTQGSSCPFFRAARPTPAPICRAQLAQRQLPCVVPLCQPALHPDSISCSEAGYPPNKGNSKGATQP